MKSFEVTEEEGTLRVSMSREFLRFVRRQNTFAAIFAVVMLCSLATIQITNSWSNGWQPWEKLSMLSIPTFHIVAALSHLFQYRQGATFTFDRVDGIRYNSTRLSALSDLTKVDIQCSGLPSRDETRPPRSRWAKFLRALAGSEVWPIVSIVLQGSKAVPVFNIAKLRSFFPVGAQMMPNSAAKREAAYVASAIAKYSDVPIDDRANVLKTIGMRK